MSRGGLSFGKKVLEIRLELGGRVICEGTTRDLSGEVTIGRAADCAWRIPPTDKTASNHHARLYGKRGKWIVEDTGSRNGMYCKGARVAQWTLSPGDQVSIGDCVLVVERAEDRDTQRAEYHRLEQINGADAGRMIDLERERSIVGSAPTCDIVCDDNLVSHRHAEIECRRDGSCWVKDLKSRNGTRVNRIPLKANERMLRDGDILSVAYVDFRFWDKNTAHTPSNIRLRAAVAAMTVLVCLAGWFFWNAAHPSADHLLKRALRQAEGGHFQEALHLTDAARLARHNASYGPQIQERSLSIRNWQNTAMAWSDIQGFLQRRLWVWAQQGYTKISKWDWNTDSAIEHKRRADCVEKLLSSFLTMRSVLENTYSTAQELQTAREAWESALADAEREPAMQAEVWPIAFEAEIGTGESARSVITNVAFRNVWHPLREAGTAVSAEIAYGLQADRQMRDALGRLADTDLMSRPAASCQETLRGLHEADQAHKAAQVADQEANRYKVLRYCALAENQYARVWLALSELAAAEQVVVSNLDTIAALGSDWENHLQPELSFPSHTDERLFTDYREVLVAANSAICGRKRTELKNIHLAAFLKMGMAEPEGTPEAIARLAKTGTIQDVMQFIDWRNPPVRWGAGTVIPGCAYDEILGCYYTHDFLTCTEDGAPDFLDRTPGQIEEDGQFCPVARKARENYAKLKDFADFINSEPLFKAAVTRTAPLPGNRANRLKQYYDRALTLLRQRDNWLEETVEPFCRGWDRGAAAARALYLVVSPRWDARMHAQASAIRSELFQAHISDARGEANGLEDYLRMCMPDATYFREWREWAESHGVLAKESAP